MRERRPASGVEARHPDIETWIAYQEGDLPVSEEDRLRGHLASCPSCVSLVLDLASFTGAREDRAEVSEFELAAAWRALEGGLREADPRPSGRRVPLPMALAASFIVGVLGLTLWGVEHRNAQSLRTQVAQLSQPQLELSLTDLEPDMATRSGGLSNPESVSRDAFSVLIMLPTQRFERYEIEIVEDPDRVVWSSSGLEPDAELETLTLGLPPGFLEPGDYRLQLYGLRDGERIALDDDLPIRAEP